MRILATIPHFHNRNGDGRYGSTGPDSDRRAKALAHSIRSLHASCGPRQAFLLHLHEEIEGRGNGRLAKVNQQSASLLDVVVCTTGDSHLVGHPALPAGRFHHQPTKADPMMLGFACHGLLKANLGRYDYYCYLEDDLALQDSLFFPKLAWFQSRFGDETLLLPHRYEVSDEERLDKLYIDGPVRPDFTAAWQDVNDRRILETTHLEKPVTFERWPNPHSGCFFLTNDQMEKWTTKPWFLDGDCSFAGPLESAASLGIMKTFRTYKPSLPCAGFLEIHHLHNRYLGEALKLPV